MERITVNTEREGFLLLDSILPPDREGIRGTKSFINAPVFEWMEALAQLGALHQRYVTDFERHAFLLKISSFTPPKEPVLNGTYNLSGVILSRSSLACSYKLIAENSPASRFEGEFIISSVEYGDKFRKDVLQKHYRKVFQCLRTDSEKR